MDNSWQVYSWNGSGIKTRKVLWSSSNKAVATVDSRGEVRAKESGKAKIITKVGNLKNTCKVTVKKKSKKKFLKI